MMPSIKLTTDGPESVSTQVEPSAEAVKQAFDASNKTAWSPAQDLLDVYNYLIEKGPPVTVVQTGSTATGSSEPAPVPRSPLPGLIALAGVGFLIFKLMGKK